MLGNCSRGLPWSRAWASAVKSCRLADWAVNDNRWLGHACSMGENVTMPFDVTCTFYSMLCRGSDYDWRLRLGVRFPTAASFCVLHNVQIESGANWASSPVGDRNIPRDRETELRNWPFARCAMHAAAHTFSCSSVRIPWRFPKSEPVITVCACVRGRTFVRQISYGCAQVVGIHDAGWLWGRLTVYTMLLIEVLYCHIYM